MAKKQITKDDVAYVAKLTNLPVSEVDTEKFAGLFTQTLDYINVLEELDTSKVEGTYQVNGLTNVFMDQTLPTTTLTQEEVFQNASEVIDEKLATDAVFDR